MNIHSVSWLLVLLIGLVGLVAAADRSSSQCGGKGYQGDGNCPTGYICKRVNDNYKQCIKSANSPEKHNYHGKNNTKKFTPVVGADGVESRLPVHRLAEDYPDVFNMYILALEEMQKKNESDELSYYQISGIHGAPFIAWQYPPTPQYKYGYCTHDSVLFSTWHRPYLLLLEQLLVKNALAIAEKFRGSEAAKYKKAAKKVRLPYWDWAADSNQGRLPEVVSTRLITVVKPSGSTTINNPLYSYNFTNDDYRDDYFDGLPQEPYAQTLRQPEDDPPVSRNDLVSNALASTFPARKLSTFQLYSIENLSRFSAARYPGVSPPNSWASVEMIHNNIHGTVGGDKGHMRSPLVAAFDPIFWLHHAQVDRLTAIYQAIFPSSTVEPLVRTQPNLGYPERGGIEDIDTLLYPFRHADGKEWTSRDVSSAESIHKYGYSYPEVPSGLSKEKLTAFASKEMQKLYAPDTDTDNFHKSPGGASVRTEWLAHVKYDQNQIAGTFNIMMYIGDVPNAPEGRVAVDTLVGTCTSFSGPQKLEYNSTIAGTVPLTPALVNKNLKPANRKEIVEYLRRNLHWKIMRGTVELPIEDLPSLQVGVSAAQVTYFEEPAKLPEYGNWSTYYEVTQKKPGGMKPEKGYLVESHDVVSVNGTSSSSTTTVQKRSLNPMKFYY